jgi:hypothetical protein
MNRGETLSRVALAKRFGRSTSWVRSQGHYVVATNGSGERETWERMVREDWRVWGYRFESVVVDGDST